jgi:hypothetical protein
MKLSEAIRDGAKRRRQVYGVGSKDEGSCALGAAREAMTGTWFGNSCVITWAGMTFPHFPNQQPCPACGIEKSFPGVVAHINDHHQWSREAIAEWVETIENKLEGDKQGDTVGVEIPAPPACAKGDAVVQELYHVEVK